MQRVRLYIMAFSSIFSGYMLPAAHAVDGGDASSKIVVAYTTVNHVLNRRDGLTLLDEQKDVWRENKNHVLSYYFRVTHQKADKEVEYFVPFNILGDDYCYGERSVFMRG